MNDSSVEGLVKGGELRGVLVGVGVFSSGVGHDGMWMGRCGSRERVCWAEVEVQVCWVRESQTETQRNHSRFLSLSRWLIQTITARSILTDNTAAHAARDPHCPHHISFGLIGNRKATLRPDRGRDRNQPAARLGSVLLLCAHTTSPIIHPFFIIIVLHAPSFSLTAAYIPTLNISFRQPRREGNSSRPLSKRPLSAPKPNRFHRRESRRFHSRIPKGQ